MAVYSVRIRSSASASQAVQQQAEQPDAPVHAGNTLVHRVQELEQRGIAAVDAVPGVHGKRHREQVSDEGEDQALGDVARLVRAARVIELRDRLGKRLRCLGQPRVANVLIEPRQIGSRRADAGGGAQGGGQFERSWGRFASARWNTPSSAEGKRAPSGGIVPW